MSIPGQIQQIIQKRQPMAQRCEIVDNNLANLQTAITEISQNEEFSSLNISSFIDEISNMRGEVSKLKSRFSRKTLNIGVIGRMRQGKSQLLQSITGLDSLSIPTSNGQATTGAKSSIQNITKNETYADVYFYSEKEFFTDVIYHYYKELGIPNPPLSMQEFQHTDLNIESNGAGASTKLKRLRKYQSECDKYKNNLLQKEPSRIEKKDITRYIAQFDPENPSNKYFDYLAVKEVRIYTNFPNQKVGNIALVDMPGLGEITVGDDKRMVRSLSEEVDIVLFVRLPKGDTGDDWKDTDVALYDHASSALESIPIKKWSFMVLNKHENGSNENLCECLANDMEAQNIRVANTFIVNAKDKTDINEKLLQPVLSYMVQHITELDKIYSQSLHFRLQNLSQKIENLKFTTKSNQIDTKGNRAFNKLFSDFYEKISGELDKYVEKLWNSRSDKNTELQDKAISMIHNMKESSAIMPTESEIKAEKAKESYTAAYSFFMAEMRNKLSESFLDLDSTLLNIVNEMKLQIVTIFATSGLEYFGKTSADFLDKITQELENEREVFPSIYSAFNSLRNFQLTYRGWLQPRIQRQLEKYLNIDIEADKLPNNPNSKDVVERLRVAFEKVLYEIEGELEGILWEPSMACYSMAYDFKNRIIHDKVKDKEWNNFMNEHQVEVWEDEFYLLSKLSSIKTLGSKKHLTLFT